MLVHIPALNVLTSLIWGNPNYSPPPWLMSCWLGIILWCMQEYSILDLDYFSVFLLFLSHLLTYHLCVTAPMSSSVGLLWGWMWITYVSRFNISMQTTFFIREFLQTTVQCEWKYTLCRCTEDIMQHILNSFLPLTALQLLISTLLNMQPQNVLWKLFPTHWTLSTRF